MKKQILLINDLPGYGKVALAAMMPILTHMGHVIYNMPTAIVSNTLDYGFFTILDTTEHIKKTIEVWKNLDFEFDAIATGFIVSEEQAKIVSKYCQDKAKKGTKIYVDPIMGDEGHLYNGVSEPTIENMKELVRIADVIVPNYTEAAYLCGMPYKESISLDEADEIVMRLRNLGAKSVIVSSAIVDGKTVVLGYDSQKDSNFVLPYEVVPVRFPGTGDMFSAVLYGELLNGKDLQTSTQRAMDVVRTLVSMNRDNKDKFKGIPIETCLDVI
ncbi:MAG: pyridoxamine kinase [Bacteroidales bacterium]|nr:pyridoxamine kinase [Bacteroidales bacterium]